MMLRTFVLREKRHLDALLSFLAGNWEVMSTTKRPMQVDCFPESVKRSLSANRYYRVILQQIARQAWIDGRQFDPDIWHEFFKRKFLGVDDLPGGGTMAVSTTGQNVQEFAAYIHEVEAYGATELGVIFDDLGETTGWTR